MAVRELTAPAGGRSRKSKYPFSTKEVDEAVKMLKANKTPGVGPYAEIREARSAAQSLVRHINAVEKDLTISTRAWEDGDECFAILRLRDSE